MTVRLYCIFILITLTGLSAAPPAAAATFTLTSCEFDVVSAALTSATDGDTLIVGPGQCDWQDESLRVTKFVNLTGSGTNRTVITRSKVTTSPMVEYLCSAFEGAFTVSGIQFRGLFQPSAQDRGLALVHGCQDFAIHNNTFTGFATAGVDVSDHINRNPHQRGVIYRNRFVENFRVGLGYGVVVSSGGRNQLVIPYGSENFVFVEDNYFARNRHAIASNLDATYVLRHNTIEDNYPNYSAVDTHGKTTPEGDDRGGTKRVEIYNNTIRQTGAFDYQHATPMNPGYSGIALRGGEALIYNNIISNYRFPLVLTVESGTQCPNLTPPILDQPTNVHIWNNELTDNQGNRTFDVSLGGNDDCQNMFVIGQDYFYTGKPGYTPYPYPHPIRASSAESSNLLELLPAIISGALQYRRSTRADN